MIDRLRKRMARRRRDRVVTGLLTTLYTQALVGSAPVELERRAGETDEAHASRELVEHNMHMTGAMLAMFLMLRNELAARDLLHLVPDQQPRVRMVPGGVLATTTATLKRTIPGKPE